MIRFPLKKKITLGTAKKKNKNGSEWIPRELPHLREKTEPRRLRSGQRIKRKSKRVVLWTRRVWGKTRVPNATARSRKARTEIPPLD